MVRFFVCVSIAGLMIVTSQSMLALAQDPVPEQFMRNTPPLVPPPNDGGAAVVIEGRGLFACSPTGVDPHDHLNQIALHTILSVNAGVPTVTELSVQSVCSSNLQDWKNAILELVTNVENSAPNAATWWGGLMLDEEDGFWTSPWSAAAYEDLNSSVRTLMGLQPGISWFYTETFSGTGVWSQTEFNLITGTSHAAPQIATDYMVSLTNGWQASTQATVLVTWSLAYPEGFNSLVLSASRINGAPMNQWGLNLSNCFTTGATVCNDWDGDGVTNPNDPDDDNDGCGDVFEPGLSLNQYNPWDFYSVPLPALFSAPNPVGLKPDNGVSASDVQGVFAYFKAGAKVGTQVYDQDLNQNGLPDGMEYDRTVLGPAQSGPPDGAIGASDAQLAFAQFKLGYVC